MDVPIAPLPGQPLASLSGLVVVSPALHNVGTQVPDGLNLDRIGPVGDADRCRHVEEPGRIGDRLPVVAGGGRDHPAPPLVVGQLRDEIHPSADLERPGRLMVLVLHPDVRPDRP
jgi:hypothetical protein